METPFVFLFTNISIILGSLFVIARLKYPYNQSF